MPDPVNQNTLSYQAPLEVNSYVSPNIAEIPKQPVDIYGMFAVNAPNKSKLVPKAKSPYELMMDGGDPFANLIPDVAPLQTNLETLKPLDDSAGLFHSQDGFGKYGYSTLLHGGDNEDRYAQNFKRDNPNLYFRPGFHPWEGIQKGFYWGGGFLEKTLESAVVKTGQGLAGLYGMTVGTGIDAVSGNGPGNFSDWLTQSTDNVFSKLFNNWDENLKNRYHYFQEASDRSKKGFVASLSDGDFWMNDISDGLGFLVSAALEVGLVSKLGLGTKVASRMSPLASGVSTAALEGTDNINKFFKVANAMGMEGAGAAFVKNAVDLTSQTLAITAIESALEAKEIKEKVYDSFQGKTNPETGMQYSEDEKKRLSAAAAAETFKQNMAILVGPKFLETVVFNRVGNYAKGLFNKSFASAETQAGKASGAVRSRLGNLSGGTTYTRNSALKNVWKVGSTAAIGFLSEGLFEENIQLAISRTAENTFGGKDEFYRPGTSKSEVDKLQEQDELFGNVGRRYTSQTRKFFQGVGDDRAIDDELSKSVGIGGLFGVGGGIIHGGIGIRQQAKVDNYWNNRLNAATSNLFESQSFYREEIKDLPDPQDPTKTKPQSVPVIDPKTGTPILDENKLKNYLNKMNNIQGIMDIVSNTEDTNNEFNKTYQAKELNKLAKNVMFSQLAMEYILAGKKQELLSNLNSVAKFSDKDIEALGYEPGQMKDGDKNQMIAKLTKMVENLSTANDWIENNVIDNVSEAREGYKGLKYSKTQKEKRQQEFAAKKAYLRGLAQQNVLLDSYLDDINNNEVTLPESPLDLELSIPLVSSNTYNARIPALKNQIDVLEKEFSYHWDNMLSKERNSPKAQQFANFSQTNNGKTLAYSQIKAQEALEKLNELQAEYDKLVSERTAFVNNMEDNDTYSLKEEDGNYFVVAKNAEQSEAQLTLDQLDAEKQRRVNAVKREEIGIQKNWIQREWQLTAALKEEKVNQDRKDTLLSRRMSLSHNAYNTYFQREVQDKDNSLGQRKLRLVSKAGKVEAKQYKANEDKILKAIRIQGKVQTILAEVNGQKLLAEIEALLDQNLNSGEFTEQLKNIIDNYNGKPIIVKNSDKNLVDAQLNDTEDELNFVAQIFEYMPEDDRFNDKYYDTDQNGNFVVKPEFDGLAELAEVQRNLNDRIDDLNKIKSYLNAIPEEVPGDWNNINTVKKRIADVYTETADSIINNYNQVSNNGQSEVAGDSLSTKQDLDLIDQEIDEIEQLNKIFTDRSVNDKILLAPEFDKFIENNTAKIDQLKKIREIVKERLSSRLRENQDFLIDAVNNNTQQLGLNFDGSVSNQGISDKVKDAVTPEVYSKLESSLKDLTTLIEKEDQTAEDKKKIADAYWHINGQTGAIQQLIKQSNGKLGVEVSLYTQKDELIKDLANTGLMQRLKDQPYYKDITNNIQYSVLGVLQLIFFQSEFSQVGVAGSTSATFLDDQPSSPVYKFREDYNLRKFIRNVERDNSRTTDNTDVSKEELLEFLNQAKKIQDMEDLQKSLGSELNMLDQVEKEKEIVQAKIDKKDNQYENLIISSIQQIFFIRSVASFLKIKNAGEGFRNWMYIQAPGGAGKTQTLGTWFNNISGIPRDRVLATAFTEEAARGIKKALLVGEEGPKDADEMVSYINELTKNKNFDNEVLIIDEFPAIDIKTQKALFNSINEYTKQKRQAGKGEFKVITMGDTNQLTFNDNGSISPRPGIIINPNFFAENKTGVNENYPAKMTIVPSLTVNFRSNIFAITSFIDQFKGSVNDNVNAAIKVTSTDPVLEGKDVKGVVSVNKAEFKNKLVSYIKSNLTSIRTRALIVNESKLKDYEKLLSDNGIKIITDPNDEVSKGVYLTTVKNVQGFSFDEVFVDLENNDKVLFSGTSSLNYIYNKSMYVAASRARNLIVVTNFPNIENTEDDSINTLENKALSELQTKDVDFIAQRDLEINAAKDILGNEYNKSVKTATPVKADEKAVSTLDPDVEEEEETEGVTEEVIEGEDTYPEVGKVEEEVIVEDTTPDEDISSEGNEVLATSEVEDNTEVEEEKTPEQTALEMMERIRDKSIAAFSKIKDSIIELLFPTGQTIKFKIADNDFTVKNTGDYEQKNLTPGDKVILIPFQQSKTSKSQRKFGYAVVTPAINSDGDVITDSYRTIAVLSDTEIDRLKDKVETQGIFKSIEENEKRNKNFVSIAYGDVSDENGFTTGNGKVINEIEEGTVQHANSVKYFYKKDYSPMNQSSMDNMIDTFIKNFYKNHLDSVPPAQKGAELIKIQNFYKNAENARIVIPVRSDIEGKNPNLKIPPEMRTYVRAGRPYLVFNPFHKRSSQQFIALSRKFLDTKEHNETLAPIRDFVGLAKTVRKDLQKKGVTNKIGYSKSLSNMMSKLAFNFMRNPNEREYKVNLVSTVNSKRVTTELTFTPVEAERLANLYSLYAQPSTQMIEAKTEKEIEGLTKVNKARNYTFEDGETIYGTIKSYDAATKTFVVRDIRSDEEFTKSGVIAHTGKTYIGQAQQALDDIMNSNSNISSKFTSTQGKVGFITDKDRSRNDVYKGYKFMALLGSKTAPVVKSYNSDGSVKESYGDVIDILEDLFNFGVKGELPAKTMEYVDKEGVKTTEVKFRVPVPLNFRNDRGELEYDFTNKAQNTSRDSAVPNAKFFETNFDTLQPTRVFVQFGEKSEEVEQEQKVGTNDQKVPVIDEKKSPVNDIKNWTEYDLKTLEFNEIRELLTPAQVAQVDAFAKKEGFNNIDHFFTYYESNHEEEQAIFRDYLIECLL